jgi:spermidine synthase
MARSAIMLPWIIVGRAESADGTRLELWQRGSEFSIRAEAGELMNSRRHGSERLLASLAVAALGPREEPRVLVGGLGCGYTLAETLARVGAGAKVVVSEISRAVVEWNRTFLAPLAERPLDDPRVDLRVGDIDDEISTAASSAALPAYDLILLDVDNGPSAFSQSDNARLYTRSGLARLHSALRPGGVLGVWSAGADAEFSARLRGAGFEVTEHRVRAHAASRGRRHLIWLARRREP